MVQRVSLEREQGVFVRILRSLGFFGWSRRDGCLCLFWLFCLLGWRGAQAEASPLQAPHIELSLQSELPSIRLGVPFWIGIHQKIEKDWHTYWQNPGDSGIAPKIRWTVPAGFQVGAIQWPTPKRIRVRVLANFGYEQEILLPLLITPPKQFSGSSVRISADLEWLVCKEECIPGRGTIHLTLPIGSASAPSSLPTSQPIAHPQRFAAIRAHLPLPWPQTQGRLLIRDEDVQIDLPDLPPALLQRRSLTFYPIDHSVISNAASLKFSRPQGILRIVVEKNEYHTPDRTTLRGLIVSRERGLPMLSYAVVAKASSAAASVPTFSAAQSVKKPTGAFVPPPASKRDPANRPVGSSLERMLARGGEDQESLRSVWWALLFAFFGGLLLNLMPCVFPVLSLKLLHFVEQAKEQPAQVKRHGWAFTAGVLLCFLALSGFLFLLRIPALQRLLGLQDALGWGYQLQSAAVLLPLILLFFAMGLILSGLFEVGSSLMGVGSRLADQGGYSGSFFSGFLATIVATPCTAPFMGGAIAFALLQPPWVGLLIFAMLGLGMASPYLLLSLNPSALRMLPRPGAWMETFKQVMAFPLYGAAIWLAWVLTSLAGPRGILLTMICALLVAFAGWLLHIVPFGSEKRGWTGRIAFLLTMSTLLWGISNVHQAQKDHRDAHRTALQEAFQEGRASVTSTTSTTSTTSAASPTTSSKQSGLSSPRMASAVLLRKILFSRKRLEQLLQQKQHVFLNFTADWCITCKANERLALRSSEVHAALSTRKVHYLVGDWTDGNKEITATLAQFKRSGVPLYVLFNGKDGSYRILPQILTPSLVTQPVLQLP